MLKIVPSTALHLILNTFFSISSTVCGTKSDAKMTSHPEFGHDTKASEVADAFGDQIRERVGE